MARPELRERWTARSAQAASPWRIRGVALFFFSSRRRHTRFDCDWSSDVCSSDLSLVGAILGATLLQTVASLAGSVVRGGLRLTPFRILDSLGGLAFGAVTGLAFRSEERRVGEECRSRWWPYH